MAKKTKRASIYTGKPVSIKGLRIPACRTVGELMASMKNLPVELPINAGFDDGVKPVWFNVGEADEHLRFEDNDGTWDDE